jgi:hypothetical protein
MESKTLEVSLFSVPSYSDMIRIAEDKVYNYFKNDVPEKIRNLKYKITNLPTIFEIGIIRVKNAISAYIRPIVKKVMGAYDPHTDTIYIDPVSVMKNFYRTLVHEIVHAYQKRRGDFALYSKQDVERIADNITEEVINS